MNGKLLSALLLAATASPSVAGPALDSLAGRWSATGWITVRTDAPMEHGRCKVDATKDEKGNGITARGRCAVVAGRGDLVFRFVDDGDGRIRAGFSSPVISGVAQLAGTLTDDSIHLTSRTPYEIGEDLFDIRSVIVFQGDRHFSVQEWYTPTGTSQWRLVTDLVFTRTEKSE